MLLKGYWKPKNNTIKSYVQLLVGQWMFSLSDILYHISCFNYLFTVREPIKLHILVHYGHPNNTRYVRGGIKKCLKSPIIFILVCSPQNIFTLITITFLPTIYWLSTDRNFTIGRKSANFRFINIDHFCESALNDRLRLVCLTVMSLVIFYSWNVTNMVSKPGICV